MTSHENPQALALLNRTVSEVRVRQGVPAAVPISENELVGSGAGQYTSGPKGKDTPTEISNSVHIVIDGVEAITDADLIDLRDAPRGTGIAAPVVQKIKHSHHEVARLIGIGMKQIDVSRITGYTTVTIHNLMNSPAFMDLVEHYSEMRDEAVMDIAGRLSVVASDALDVLHERINEEGEDKMDSETLRKVTKDILDRAGHSPVSRSESRSINIGLTKDDIIELKSVATRSSEHPQRPILDGTAEEVDKVD